MELCFSAQIVILLSIIGISLDIYLAGMSFVSFFIDILVSAIFVFMVNWACFREGYTWLIFLILIINMIGIITIAYLIKNKNKEDVSKFIQEERKKRGK